MHAHQTLTGSGIDARISHGYRLAVCGIVFPLALAVGLVLGASASRALDGHPVEVSAPAVPYQGAAGVVEPLPAGSDRFPAGWHADAEPPTAALPTGLVATGNGTLGATQLPGRGEHYPPGWHDEVPAP